MAFIYCNVSHHLLPSLGPLGLGFRSHFSSLAPPSDALFALFSPALGVAVGVGVGLLPALSQLTRPPLHALLHPFPPNRSPCFPSATRLLALPLLSCPRAAAVPHSCCFPEPPGYVLLPSWSLSFSKGSPGIRGLLNQSHKGQRVCHTAVTPESHTDCSFCLPQ